MSTVTIDVNEAQTQLASLLTLVAQGNRVVISKNLQPVAQLMPIHKQNSRRTPGLHRGAMRMRHDFNDPLPDSFWLGET
jgi:prevent-host-death family protein